MYESVGITNIRCLRHLSIDSTARVNLLAGRNNVGKTACLEALFLHAGAYRPELTFTVGTFRGITKHKVELSPRGGAPWDNLFSDFDSSQPAEVSAATKLGRRVMRLRTVSGRAELASIGKHAEQPTKQEASLDEAIERVSSLGAAKVLELEYEDGTGSQIYHLILDPKGQRTEPIPPAPPFPAHFLSSRAIEDQDALAGQFSALQEAGQEGVVFDALSVIEPRLKSLKMTVTGSGPLLQGDVGLARTVPLPLMGEGMVRLAAVTIHLGAASGGVLLVDEIDNGLHHSVLQTVWATIGEIARRYDTQVFATTHSRECVVAAHRAFCEAESYDFRLHRLESREDGTHCVTLDQDALEGAIEIGLEVR